MLLTILEHILLTTVLFCLKPSIRRGTTTDKCGTFNCLNENNATKLLNCFFCFIRLILASTKISAKGSRSLFVIPFKTWRSVFLIVLQLQILNHERNEILEVQAEVNTQIKGLYLNQKHCLKKGKKF